MAIATSPKDPPPSAPPSTRWRPPAFALLAIGFFLLYAALAVLMVRGWGLPRLLPLPPLPGWIAGGALLLSGSLLMLRCFRACGALRLFGGELGRAGGLLMRSGPYAVIRHPLYVAVLTQLAGWLLLTRVTAVLALLLLFALHFLIVGRWEERELARRFGAEHAAYRREVPALWPRLRRQPKSAVSARSS